MRDKILKLLMQNPHGYVSGEEMASQLGVSRAAVNKHVEKLKAMGCEIDCKRNAGYRLASLSDSLLPEFVEIYRFDAGEAPYTILHYDRVASTNQTAKELAVKGAAHGTVVVAEVQTAGRGRQGRTWTSNAGEGIFCSLILRPPIAPQEAHLFSLMAGVAVARGVSAQGMLPNVGLKWPNDVLCGPRKLCGILCELSADLDGVDYAVLGIGINVNQPTFGQELMGVATSMAMETGRVIPRARVLAAVLAEFFDLYAEAMGEGTPDFASLMEEYAQWSVCLNRPVTAIQGKRQLRGVCVGFGPDGSLRLRDEAGTVHAILAGDVSIRGEGLYA